MLPVTPMSAGRITPFEPTEAVIAAASGADGTVSLTGITLSFDHLHGGAIGKSGRWPEAEQVFGPRPNCDLHHRSKPEGFGYAVSVLRGRLR